MPSTYVNSFDSKQLAPSSEHEDRQLIPGTPVKVTHGKHEGKRGVLSSVRRYVSVVVEDQTGVQVKISFKRIKEDKLLTLHPSYLCVMNVSNTIRPCRCLTWWRVISRSESYGRRSRNSLRPLGWTCARYVVEPRQEFFLTTHIKTLFTTDGKQYLPFQAKASTMEDNAKEPWTNMLKREERTRRFWRYANALGYLDKDLIQPSASEHDEGRQGVDPTSLALVAFATQVGIQLLNDNGDKTLFESFAPSQEYVRWTSEFCGLAKNLGIEVRHLSER